MLQLQYYNKGLSKTQIEQILKNYNLKYSTITNEISLKLNSLIKTVLNDISPFLENIEYLSRQSKQLKDFENAKNRIESLENTLKEKINIEKELQDSIISLKQEISDLKEKEKEFEKYKLKAEQIKSEENNLLTKQNSNFNRKKTIDQTSHNCLINSSFDKTEAIKEQNTFRDNLQKNLDEENNIHIKSPKKSKNKNIPKWNKNNKYMMNLKEITRNLNGYHEQIQLTKNYKNMEKLDKFICSSNNKDNNGQKNYKNKRRKNRSSDQRINKNNNKERLSDDINNVKHFEIIKDEEDSDNNNYNYDKDKNFILYDEEIDEEIKNLDMDEQNILELINKINNYGKE